MVKRFFSILLFCTILAPYGCSDEPAKPENLIPEDDYIDLIVELQMIRSFMQSPAADSISIDSLIDSVMNKYSTSREQFSTSHNYYQEFPEQQRQRIESAIERLRMDEVQEDTLMDTTGTADTEH